MTEKKTDKQTRFPPGVSGNPAGRAPGSGWIGKARQQLQRAWEGEEKDGSDGVRHQLLAKAKAGDPVAIRLVADRVVPALKAVEPPTTVMLPVGGTLTEKATAVLDALGTGKLPVGTGAQLLTAIGSLARVLEIDELARRLEALERAQESKP